MQVVHLLKTGNVQASFQRNWQCTRYFPLWKLEFISMQFEFQDVQQIVSKKCASGVQNYKSRSVYKKVHNLETDFLLWYVYLKGHCNCFTRSSFLITSLQRMTKPFLNPWLLPFVLRVSWTVVCLVCINVGNGIGMHSLQAEPECSVIPCTCTYLVRGAPPCFLVYHFLRHVVSVKGDNVDPYCCVCCSQLVLMWCIYAQKNSCEQCSLVLWV